MSSPQKVLIPAGYPQFTQYNSKVIKIPVIISQAQNHECLSIHLVSLFYIFTEFYKSLETSLLCNYSRLIYIYM